MDVPQYGIAGVKDQCVPSAGSIGPLRLCRQSDGRVVSRRQDRSSKDCKRTSSYDIDFHRVFGSFLIRDYKGL